MDFLYISYKKCYTFFLISSLGGFSRCACQNCGWKEEGRGEAKTAGEHLQRESQKNWKRNGRLVALVLLVHFWFGFLFVFKGTFLQLYKINSERIAIQIIADHRRQEFCICWSSTLPLSHLKNIRGKKWLSCEFSRKRWKRKKTLSSKDLVS